MTRAPMERHPEIVHRRDLSFLEKLYLPQIAKGLWITLAQVFRPKFTRQYPEERWTPPPSFRGRPVLVEQQGIERCVACGLCARVCPALAIELQASESEFPKERYPLFLRSTCFAAFSAVFVKRSVLRRRS